MSSRVTAAFASDRQASDALGYIHRHPDLGATGRLRHVDGSTLAFVDVDVDAANRDRVLTLLRGAKGVVL